MTHPSKKKLFVAWAKAMVEGATVGKPDYGKGTTGGGRKYRSPRRTKRLRRGQHQKRKKED